MTPQEDQLLSSLIERVNQTQLDEKDPDAEALLNRSLGSNPDALYILAQTVLVQNIALEQAKAQVTQLQQQVQQAKQPAHATSFLGNLLGRHDAEPARPAPPPSYQTGYQPQAYQPVEQQYAQPVPAYSQPQYVAVPPSQPSFLRGAMQTAAGVAAGALAFEGVESILHGFGHPGYGWGAPAMGMGGMGMSGFGMGGGFERPVEETVINNNYFDDRGSQSGLEHSGGERHFHESAADQNYDERGGAQLSDADYRTNGEGGNELDAANADDSASYDDQASYDDSANFDDTAQDDGASFDDGGGFDSGGGDLL